jgi:large subunit ribosomal protein L29
MNKAFKEFSERKDEELRLDLAEQRKHLFTLRTQSVTEKLEDPTQIGKTKKKIARIMTALKQREKASK